MAVKQAPAARALGDPRVRLLGEPDGGAAASQDLPPTPARGDLDAVRSVPDWSVDVHVPLRPAAAGARPDADAVAAWLLRLERAGVERVEVLGEPAEPGERAVLAVLTCARARWRHRRGGTARVWRVPASRLGWAPVAAVPDLEAWWGGWG